MLSGILVFCFVFGGVFLLASALLGGHGDVGADVDADADLDFGADVDGHVDLSHDVGGHHGEVLLGSPGPGKPSRRQAGLLLEPSGHARLTPFSPIVLSLFLTTLGGVGLILNHSVLMNSLSFLILIPAGVIAAGVSGTAMVCFNTLARKVEGTSHSRRNQVIGMEARVTIAISPGKVGEITYVSGGTRYNALARSSQEEPIPREARVRIDRIENETFWVRSLEGGRSTAA